MYVCSLHFDILLFLVCLVDSFGYYSDVATPGLCNSGDDAFYEAVASEQDTPSAISLLQRSVVASKSQSVQSISNHVDITAEIKDGRHVTANPYLQNVTCIKDTGGTCLFSDCYKWRGPTLCSDLGRCMCAPGYCAAAGGRCFPSTDKLVAKGFRLVSAAYPSFSMSTPTGFLGWLLYSILGNVIIVSTNTNDQNSFDLYELPNQGEKPSKFLLAPALANNTVVAVNRYRQRHVTYFLVDTDSIEDALDQPASVQSLTMNVLIGKHLGKQAVVLQSFAYPSYCLGVNWWSSLVSAQWTWKPKKDPSLEAIWYPDPPLPFKERRVFSGATRGSYFWKFSILPLIFGRMFLFSLPL